MIDPKFLLQRCQGLQKRLEADLLERSQSAEVPHVQEKLREEYLQAYQAKRTGHAYEAWRHEFITQHAAAWVITCVFVRFLEDNLFLHPPKISGPYTDGDLQCRWLLAREQHDQYFFINRGNTDRDYLLELFHSLAGVTALKGLFGDHNPIHDHPTWLSPDAAGEIIAFFQQKNAGTGLLELDFTSSPESIGNGEREETRYLGDLYQDLSLDARKRFALLQTPDFVERFILDRTLEPAWEEWQANGRQGNVFRMIDPACGSGHFLLGSFHRILNHWQRLEPGTPVKELVQRSLDSIHGVDLNPFAIAITRFRLLVAALRACGTRRVADMPNFQFHLACGDSLLHGSNHLIQGVLDGMGEPGELHHAYQPEDLSLLRTILVPGRYQAVVANPPYITVKDKATNEDIRLKYKTCHRQYALSVPFMERIFQLAAPSGFTGQITSNSFMKRQFGTKLVNSFLPTINLTHVIDTSGAYIPGHGTPTVILLGRQRRPVSSTIRAVLGIRGEPSAPADPAFGLVWSAIVKQLDDPGSESLFVSTTDMEREKFYSHPWSIGGGGASELKEKLYKGKEQISEHINLIGFICITRADEIYFTDKESLKRYGVLPENIVINVEGDKIRDWFISNPETAIFPYNADLSPVNDVNSSAVIRFLWIARTILWTRREPNGDHRKLNLTWYEWSRFQRQRYRIPLSITFSSIATHNHFVLDRGGKVFNRSAPVIKLSAGSTEDDHFPLVGLLNSSVACFWMKQVFQNRGSTVDQHGARQRTAPFEDFYDHDGTKLKQFPIPWEKGQKANSLQNDICAIARLMDDMAQQKSNVGFSNGLPAGILSHELLDNHRRAENELFAQMVSLQEELDWVCYAAYGLIPWQQSPTAWLGQSSRAPSIQLGQRAFEIALARQMAAGEEESEWFNRHRSIPITEVPAVWDEWYQKIVERRLELIETNPDIALIEKPEFKRRWNQTPWEDRLKSALRDWLLLRLEGYFDLDGRMERTESEPTGGAGKHLAFREPALVSLARLAEIAGRDEEFLNRGGIYRNDPAFDVYGLVQELVEDETVPLLPVCRYKPEGLIKRTVWERTWDLQRAEDRGEEVGSIPVPPKYGQADFQKTSYWGLRGKLDVPKERWVSFPGVEAADGTPLVAWAGYNHLQLARALAEFVVQVFEREGGSDDLRLVPLLAGILELVPWLKQWHNEPDPEFGIGMGNYFADFVQEQALKVGKTTQDLKAWTPTANSRGRRVSAPKAGSAEPGETKPKRGRGSSVDRDAIGEQILSLAREVGKVTNSLCKQKLGESVSAATVSQVLKAMSENGGPLEKVGSKGPAVFYTMRE